MAMPYMRELERDLNLSFSDEYLFHVSTTNTCTDKPQKPANLSSHVSSFLRNNGATARLPAPVINNNNPISCDKTQLYV
jgi:hypothetical protein